MEWEASLFCESMENRIDHENCRLCIFRFCQHLQGTFKHNRLQIHSQDSVRRIDDRTGFSETITKGLAHPHELNALSRKEQRILPHVYLLFRPDPKLF